MILGETIIALSTPPGVGAIAVIRLSGPEAVEKVDSLFCKPKKQSLRQAKSHTAHFGVIRSGDHIIDEVLITLFRAPRSYTGEDVIEISCHGSMFIQQKIIQLFVDNGVRLARSGEFTLRAFLNKKMDLSQAEAVADLIASESEVSHQIAMEQMRGGFSREIETLRGELVNFSALIELELDFSEEDIEFADRKKLSQLLSQLKQKIQQLADSFSYGNAVKEGVAVVIAGKPNVGKSTLLNTLFNEEKAIVSDIPGTTRDSIEDTLIIDGIKFRFIDTAGIRETKDSIEAIGVARTKEKVAKARILLYLFDRFITTPEEVINDIKALHHKGLKTILVDNKIDRYGGAVANEFIQKIMAALQPCPLTFIAVSGNDKESVKPLKKMLAREMKDRVAYGTVITNVRHYNALQKSLKALQNVQNALADEISSDFLAIDLKEVLYSISEITGRIDIDKDILETIFGRFCIGK